MTKPRILIVDDEPANVTALARLLERSGYTNAIGTTDSSDVVRLCREAEPDLIMLDLRMPNMDGLACLDEIVKRFPEIKVVMLSASTSPELIAAALRRGASAYLAKSVDPSDLPSTLRQVLEGNVWRQNTVADEDVESGGKAFGLTDRETAILQALARGLSNDEIAKELWVTQQTVKFHLTNIYRKLGAKNRTQATRIAQQHGLVDSPLFGDDE